MPENPEKAVDVTVAVLRSIAWDQTKIYIFGSSYKKALQTLHRVKVFSAAINLATIGTRN